jgi:hypothetical protein
MLKLAGPILSVLLASTAVHAADGAPATSRSIDEFLKKNGTASSLESIAPSAIAGFEAAGGSNVPPMVVEAFKASARSALSQERLLPRLEQAMARVVTEADLQYGLAMLVDPLAQRMTRMEEQANSAEAVPRVQAFIANLEKDEAAMRRMPLVQRLAKDVGAIDLTLQVGIASALATVAAMQAIEHPGQPLSDEQSRAFGQQVRQQSQAVVERQVLGTYLFTYRGATDEELTRYCELQETPQSQRLIKSYSAATAAALTEAGTAQARLFAETLQGMKAKSPGAQPKR